MYPHSIAESVNIATIVTPKTNISPLEIMAASWKIIFLLPRKISYPGFTWQTPLYLVCHTLMAVEARVPCWPQVISCCVNGQLPVGTLFNTRRVAEVDEFLRTPCHTTGSMGYLFKHHIALQLFEHSTDIFKDHSSDGFHFPTWRESVPCGVTLPSPGNVSHVHTIDT